MSIRIGDKAPEFSLYSSEKQLTHLSDYRGKNVVLLFFPLAFTSTCTKELCATRDDIEMYQVLHAEILAISGDSPQSLARYKQELQLPFTLLSDYNKEAMRAYNSMYEEYNLGMRGVAKRAVFVMDGDGIIRHLEVLENASSLPDLAAVQNALRILQPV